MVELGSRTKAARLLVGFANFFVIDALVLQNFDLQEASGCVEGVVFYKLVGALGGQVLAFGAHDSPECFDAVIGSRVAGIANIAVLASSGVEQVGPQVHGQAAVAILVACTCGEFIGQLFVGLEVRFAASTEVLGDERMDRNAAVLSDVDVQEALTHELQSSASVEAKSRENLRRHRDWSMSDHSKRFLGFTRERFRYEMQVVSESVQISEMGLLQEFLGKEFFATLRIVVGNNKQTGCKGVSEGSFVNFIDVLFFCIFDVVSLEEFRDVVSRKALEFHGFEGAGLSQSLGLLGADKHDWKPVALSPKRFEEHGQSVISIQASVASKKGFDSRNGQDLFLKSFSLESRHDAFDQIFWGQGVFALSSQNLLVPRDFTEARCEAVKAHTGSQNHFFEQFQFFRLSDALFNEPVFAEAGCTEEQCGAPMADRLEQGGFFCFATEKNGLRGTASRRALLGFASPRS